MFTGLIEALGTVRLLREEPGGARLVLVEPRLAPELKVGESVAVNGACLTVVDGSSAEFSFQLGPETLARTNLGELQSGDRVNLERALRVGDRLGGHFVQGHIDGVGRISSRRPEGDYDIVWFEAPPELTREMVEKGSVAVDGVSLTLVDVTSNSFSVMLIPHTLTMTTLGWKGVNDRVNLETDMLGKYATKLLGKGGGA
jgi:riboflavin synthase